MTVAASQILDFLETREDFTIERHVIASPPFSILRQSLRQIVLKLSDSDEEEAHDISARIRVLLSEWLTVPVIFDKSMADAVHELFGDAQFINSRWGSDILKFYETAVEAAEAISNIENPLRENLRDVITGLILHKRNFKVYCHRRARPYFESLIDTTVDMSFEKDIFLHSVRDYRETRPFDVLIKVGPLRSGGWGSAPDALLTAPRFDTLVLFVWSGCHDEPGFGYDPSLVTTSSGVKPVTGARTINSVPRWAERVTRTGQSTFCGSGHVTEVDELQVFKEARQRSQTRPARLVQVDAESGLLFAPFSQVLSFDPTKGVQEPIAHRIPGETLLEGMFVLMPILGDISLGGVQAKHGYYSQIWKSRLEQEWKTDPLGFIDRLYAGGLNLVHLASAIMNWCRPPGTVIHAPKKFKHFEILLRVLGIESETFINGRTTDTPWSVRAWNEIRRSRGEAIQAGVLENEIIEEELMVIIKNLLPDIRNEAIRMEPFTLTIPANSGMTGSLSVFPVCGIEEGFCVPETQLRIVHDLTSIDQWRD